MYVDRLIALFVVGAFLLSPLIIDWWSEGGSAWYRPYTIWAMLQRLGCEVLDLGVVRDEPAALRAAVIAERSLSLAKAAQLMRQRHVGCLAIEAHLRRVVVQFRILIDHRGGDRDIIARHDLIRKSIGLQIIIKIEPFGNYGVIN